MNDININIKIKNIPNPEDYFNKSYEIFIDSLNDIININNIKNNKDKYKKEKIKLMTNIHHISEIYLSGLILEKNPLDLIKIDNISDYSIEKDYDDFSSIQAHLLYDVAKNKLESIFFDNFLFDNNTFQNVYHNNRKLRNKNMHSIVRDFNINLNQILMDFLTIWYLFFKKSSFIKDFYRLIQSTEVVLKEKEKEIVGMGFYLKRVEKEVYYKILRKNIEIRKIFLNFLKIIQENLNEKNFKKLINYKEDIKSFCICPNCKSTINTEISLGYSPFIKQNKFDENLFPKSLIIRKDQRKANCYICGYNISNKLIKKSSCKDCKKDTYFSSTKIKVHKKGKFNKNYYFCLYCGCPEKDIPPDI